MTRFALHMGHPVSQHQREPATCVGSERCSISASLDFENLSPASAVVWSALQDGGSIVKNLAVTVCEMITVGPQTAYKQQEL